MADRWERRPDLGQPTVVEMPPPPWTRATVRLVDGQEKTGEIIPLWEPADGIYMRFNDLGGDQAWTHYYPMHRVAEVELHG